MSDKQRQDTAHKISEQLKISWSDHAVYRWKERLAGECEPPVPESKILLKGAALARGTSFKVRTDDVVYQCQRIKGGVKIITVYPQRWKGPFLQEKLAWFDNAQRDADLLNNKMASHIAKVAYEAISTLLR